MSAVISKCGTYRMRLDRSVRAFGPVYAFFGVNGSTADADTDDHTVRKWIGFTDRLGGSRFIVGNPFDLRATDVRALGSHNTPFSAENDQYLDEIIAEADVLVPCWGNRAKVPSRLHFRFDLLTGMIFEAAKPVKVFGLTASGDPKHPLMLGYDTPLVDWVRR